MSQLYQYHAYSESGELVKGELYADSEESAMQTLKKDYRVIVKIAEQRNSFQKGKITTSDLEQSTSQLATLLRNGLKIDKALIVLAKSNNKSAMGKLWSLVLSDIKQGELLSLALAKRPETFSTLYVEMVKIGESTGNLPIVFNRLSQNLRFQSELKSKVIQAITYPCFILIVCLLAIWAIFNFVIPSMSSMFESVEDIPSYTQFLISASEWIQNYQYYVFLILFIGIVVILSALKKHEFKVKLIEKVTSFPLVKTIIKQADRIRFATALQLTLESGVSLSAGLTLASQTVINPVLRQRLKSKVDAVSAGSELSIELAKLNLFDDIGISLISVGEESGTLAESFSEIATRSRVSFEQWLSKFTAMLEPLLILVMGGVVGSVVITMLLSIVSINDVSF
ncbi:secretion system protein [Pseudoalteromonas lipolytica SCSIO 04301]|uniref:General secretion pathway protein F n=1 Tax=Pseudoalteromonas lipolytica TaxID=570156 RepID=A0ABY1GPK5_9GAMM|nr:type II secretion system F family protein [Pseudoalteromonas lipolytica]EWH04609.1 secretion system protein [Pseudoalteromonas lipolytica SCSIO 04301]MBE0349614.1 general secretion pathway protein F [Pseudoalteromonas lipolytica LMEB 39]SFT78056.1 general secretion pathway protein F [Pseudoalteromonas lipolytica]